MNIRLTLIGMALAVSFPVTADVKVSQEPLAKATAQKIPPNLLFMLDDSGSMGWDYTPDYVDDSSRNYCKNKSGGAWNASCDVGDPPFMSPDFNKQYYNPEILYSPPVDHNKTPRTPQNAANTDNWTKVKTDGFSKQNTDMRGNSLTTSNLVTGFPDKEWYCDSSWKLNTSSYLYPDSTCTNSQFSTGAPYYYRIQATEYCTDETFTNCVSVALGAASPSPSYPQPAKVRWCKDSATAALDAPGNNCQAKYLGSTSPSFRFVRYSKPVHNNVSSGTITIGASALATTGLQIQNIKVGATTIADNFTITGSGTNTAAKQRCVATQLANKINTKQSTFKACVDNPDSTCGSGVTACSPLIGQENVVRVYRADGTTASAGQTLTATSTSVVSVKSTGFLNITGSSTSGKTTVLRELNLNGVDYITSDRSFSSNTSASSIRNSIVSHIGTGGSTVKAYSGGNSVTPACQAKPTTTVCLVYQGNNNGLGISLAFRTPTSTYGTFPYTTEATSGGVTDTIPITTTAFTAGSTPPNAFQRVDIINDGRTFTKHTARTDCVTTAGLCTYTEEMTNFANWYAYYRTRMQAMKSATSIAFADIDDRFRIGYSQINSLGGTYLKMDPFNATQRTLWYNKLTAAYPSGSTPLRAALSFAGKLYAGQKPSGVTDDPIIAYCQQNFTMLTTDGYWNANTTSSHLPSKIDGTAMTNQDGTGTATPYYEGTSVSTNSLADTAMYYYNTDLRTPTLANCSPTDALTPIDSAKCDECKAGPPTKSASECSDCEGVCYNGVAVTAEDKNQQQHMTTYTLGLGVDGEVTYRSDYKTALTGDFSKIKSGTLNWPAPVGDTQTAVDDLWHAAVNGRGQYFSAQDPAKLVSGLKEALANISSQFGSGAAAATSNLEPVQGDNYIYVATYTTGKWIGNLEARTINTTTGQPNKQCVWALEDVAADDVAGTAACSGKLTPEADGATTRNILFNKAGALANFTPSNVPDKSTNFNPVNLSQYSSWSPEFQAAATPDNLINYLRGQTGFEARDSNTYQLYRQREAVLGDIVDSKPVYICKPQFNYTDPGYQTFKDSFGGTGACTRTPMIYIGANDGMLHAINATATGSDTGKEEWAFVPTPAISEMWRLADANYSTNHRFFVDGSQYVNNVCVSNCNSESAVWKTILIGAMGYGVVEGSNPDTGAARSGFYALDVTDPLNPILLWEKHSQSAGYTGKIGFATGNVIIGKVMTGADTWRWAAVFASGYKPADGQARIFVIDAYTGNSIPGIANEIIVTGGDGLARIKAATNDPDKDATFSLVYGGDLSGNVWRINVETGATAKIFSTGTTTKAITTRPEISTCNGKNVIYVGTGKFFESTDPDNDDEQTVYSFVDDYDTSGSLTPSALTSLSISTSGTQRTFASGGGGSSASGWYFNLPDTASGQGGSERVNVDPLLQAGSLVFVSNVPELGVCVSSGHSWTNSISLRTCSSSDKVPAVTGGTSTLNGNELGVGITIIKIGGKYVPIVTGSGGSVQAIQGIEIGSGNTAPQGKFTGWRELLR